MPLRRNAKANRFLRLPQTSRDFGSRVRNYETAAAAEATKVSQTTFNRWLSRRPLAPPRPGRPTTGGAFVKYVQWGADSDGVVRFRRGALETAAPYWLIQEVGTGHGVARMLDATGKTLAEVNVRSQKGRVIKANLYWADGPGEVPVRPRATRGRRERSNRLRTAITGLQQLYPISDLPEGVRPPRAGVIRREITPKHFVRDGGQAGFNMLRRDLIADAKRTFR